MNFSAEILHVQRQTSSILKFILNFQTIQKNKIIVNFFKTNNFGNYINKNKKYLLNRFMSEIISIEKLVV